MTVIGSSKIKYQLDDNPLSDGGEGTIYRVLGGTDKKVAKIYKPGVLTGELAEKLMLMLKDPPDKTVLTQVAWPLDLLYGADGQACGFVMPQLSINAELGDVYKYNPSDTKKTLPISIQQKIIVAQNICAVITAVHNAGYVFGDFNPRNIALDMHTGTVAFLDTDSYHVTNQKTKKVYRCSVCAPGYAAPELLAACSAHSSRNPGDKGNIYAKTPLPTFTKETDNFALAIHIFKLLMNGYTPFGGIPEKASVSQASPGTGDAPVRRDNYCFKPGHKHQSAAILPLSAFPQKISDLITRAFIAGKSDPKQRPTAREWHGALGEYQKGLRQCPNSPLHQYDKKNATCPYCEADKRYLASIGTPFIQKPKAAPTKTGQISPQRKKTSVVTQAQTPANQIKIVQTQTIQTKVVQTPVVQTQVVRTTAAQIPSAQSTPPQTGFVTPVSSATPVNANTQGMTGVNAAPQSYFKRLLSSPASVAQLVLMLAILLVSIFSGNLFPRLNLTTNDSPFVNERFVNMVKNGYKEDNPEINYDIAFSSYFSQPEWRYFRSTDGVDVVEFTGDCTYRNAPAKARIQFVIDEENGTFEAAFLAYNEVSQTMNDLDALIDTAFISGATMQTEGMSG